jgi:protein-S-isoprenylcysteine O-methyltransferase Ste14
VHALLVRYGNFLFRTRDAVFPIVLFSLLLIFRPEYPLGSPALDGWLDALGITVALLGQLLRAAVVGYAYIVRGGRNRRVYAEGLVTEGFFAHARNPLYLGNLLILAGLFLIWNSRWVYLIGVPFFLIGYVAIVAAEEAFLRGKFGEAYDRYSARVSRWLPNFRGLGDSLAGMRFNWRRVILKEYGSAAYWMAGAVVLIAMDQRLIEGYVEGSQWLWWLLVPVAFGWATARWAKKTKRLRETIA